MSLPQENRYTPVNAPAWDEQDRIELIDGYPVMMARPPGRTRKPSWSCRPSSTHILRGLPVPLYHTS